MKPPFIYYGSKASLAERIVALLPPHRHYVEPFAGSLAVLLAKPPTPCETVNDLDGHLMTFWRVLRDQPGALVRACALTPHGRQEYQSAYDLDGCDDLELARRVWVILSQGRAGTMRRTGWRYFEAPSTSGMPRSLTTYVQRMEVIADRLRSVSLECLPALDLIQRYGKHAGVLIYADPPYLGSTRASRQYGHEMSQVGEHRELAEALRNCTATVVLSGYHSPLYDDLYADWYRTELSALAGNAPSGKSARTEVLWSNAPLTQRDLTLAEEAS